MAAHLTTVDFRRLAVVALVSEFAFVLGATQLTQRVIQLNCPSRALFGIQCPGCGSTRCVQAIGHGNFGVAFRENPMTASAFLVIALGSLMGLLFPKQLQWLIEYLKERRVIFGAGLASLTLVFGVVRNIV